MNAYEPVGSHWAARRDSIKGWPRLLSANRLNFGWLAFVCLASWAFAAEPQPIRVGSELDFRPYAFIDDRGQPAGFSVDLVQAVSQAMGLPIHITTTSWDRLWEGLLKGQLDVLPIVANTPGRQSVVDFSLPHTETFDAFFVRANQGVLPNLAAAAGKEIVVMRSDAAHQELLSRQFSGKIFSVDTIPQGLELVASGHHDAFLCSKLIGTLEIQQHRIRGLKPGPPVPDYKRVFAFAVRKGNAELLEKLNQGLRIIKTNGEYERIYQRWLAADAPWANWKYYFGLMLATLAGLAGLAGVLQWLVRRRTRELASANQKFTAEVVERRAAQAELQRLNATLEERVAERTAALRESEARFRTLVTGSGPIVFRAAADGAIVDAPGWEAITGQPRNLYLGQGWYKMVHPEDQASVNSAWSAGLAKGEPVHVDYRINSRDGEWRWMHSYGVPVRGDKGEIIEWVGTLTDIHERHLAQEKLKRNEERLRLAAKAARLFAFEWDPITDVVRREGDSEGILGVAINEETGASFFARIHPDDRARFAQLLSSLVPDSDSYTATYRVLRPGGGEAVLEESARAFFDERGRFVRLIGMTADITSRKKAEQELQERDAQFSALVSNLHSGVALVDEHGKFAIFNSAFLKLFGLSAGVENVNDQDWARWQVFGEDGRLLHVDDHPVRKAALTRKPVRNQLVRVQRPSGGNDVWLLVSAEPILKTDGQLRSLICTYYDLTDRKQAEEALQQSEAKYRTLFENMAEEVHFWQILRDDAGQILTWRLVDANPPSLKTWGRNNIEEVRGKTTDEIFGEGATSHYLQVVQKVMTERVPHGFEDYFPHLDRHFRFTTVPVGDCFITTGADITRIKKAEERLKVSLHEKEVLLKEIHHRVKNNLQVIASLVDLQTNTLADPSLQGLFQEVRDRVRSMALVHEKLYQSESLARVDFADYAGTLLAYLSRAHSRPGCAIEVKTDLKPVSLSVEQAVPCGLILNELISNAFKHAFRDRTHGTVWTRLDFGPDGRVRLRVSDSGVGLPPGLDWRHARSLGLRLVQLLAGQLHATVQVQTGSGTEFEIAFEPEKAQKEDVSK